MGPIEDPVVSSTTNDTGGDATTTVDRLSWRMDPDHSFTDWTIEIYLPAATATATTTAAAKRSRSSGRLHGTYHVHRNILGVGRKSEYWEHLFRGTYFSESREKVSRIELIELAAVAFPVMLDYFYGFDVDSKVDHESSAALYHLGEYFGVPSLCAVVESYWQDQAFSCNQLGVLYEHAKIFGIEKLENVVLQACCRNPSTIRLDSDLARRGGSQFWRAVLQTNNGTPNADLCDLIADYCLSEDGDLNVYRKLREEDGQFTIISIARAIKFLRLEESINSLLLDDSSYPIAFNGIQQSCIEALADCWAQLDDTVLQESLTKLHPRVLTEILQTSLRQAKQDVIPDKIVVSGAGVSAVNGTYVCCYFEGDPAPKYLKEEDGEWNGEIVDFTLHLCMMKSITWKWFLSIADDDQPGTDRDIDFYSSAPCPTMRQMLPLTRWRVAHHGQGQAPVPSFKYVYNEN